MEFPKIVYKFFVLFLTVVSFSSCSSDDNSNSEKEFVGESGINSSESKDLWISLKSTNKDSYEYTIETASWTGFATSTTIKVENGEVVSREFISTQPQEENPAETETVEEYMEAGSDLGTHESGAEILTIDELYSLCFAEYLTIDTDSNLIYFDTTSEGVINTCGYVNKNCADDCFVGFKLTNFTWL
ncbi:hypothetical protein ACNI3T_01635 [Christiangramia sp. ASW11-125]|uniref:hypothetical protein n=1 Tax=Christiangramia sp. ASW11-125 TaxID=3400701 RepID=UPI003AB00BBF